MTNVKETFRKTNINFLLLWGFNNVSMTMKKG